MTDFIKKDEIKNNWLLIDAENAIVGRLAAYISKALRGKNKNQYTPHMDNGDFVVVTNIEKIRFTGKKINNKKYYRHTGYPGGIKSTTPSLLMKKKPEEVLKLAETIASKSKKIVKIGKEAFYKQLEMPLDEAYK